jgi:hypothetical protein
MRKSIVTIVAVVCALTLMTASAQASSLVLNSGTPLEPTPPASFTADLSYDSGLSQLTVLLTNTTPLADGGLITGFVFNTADSAVATLTSPGAPWEGLSDENAAPFGTFEFGAALGGDWEGGGNPNNGIGAGGEAATFMFDITLGGDPAGNAVDVNDFVTQDGSGGSHEGFFVVRFRGYPNDGSNKVPAIVQTPPIPLPAALWSALSMLGALAGTGAVRRMRRSGLA